MEIKKEKKENFINFLLLFITVAAVLVITEYGLRFSDIFNYNQIPAKPFGELFDGYPMKANYSFMFWGNIVLLPPSNITTNSYGLRDREYSIRKNPDIIRILCLGDSVTFGQGVSLEHSFPKKLEQLFNESGKMKIEVLNFAVPGTGTVDQLRLLEELGLKFQPDIVILTIIGNDYENQLEYGESTLAKVQKILNNGSESYTLRWMRDLISIAHFSNSKLSENEKSNKIIIPLKSILDLSHSNNFTLIVAQGYGTENLIGVTEFFLDNNILFVNLHRIDLPREAKYLKVKKGKIMDGHFTEPANQKVAELLYTATRKVVATYQD
ncbi:MAG: SGNH/GDSL hydrolase family protein [Nanoarchaeota archaeon]|nr:SGNH/GDSL hydrolase family protein [Nanoarchaeota archaeon]